MAAHYAVSSLFEIYEPGTDIYCYHVDSEDYHRYETGKAKLAFGRVRVRSNITYDAKTITWGALYFGDHNLSCGVREFLDEAHYRAMVTGMAQAFSKADLPETLRAIDRHFGGSMYSLKSLFGDQQRRIFNQILETTMADIELGYRQVYEHHASLMKFLSDIRMPLPKALHTAAEFVLNMDLRRAIEADTPDLTQIRAIFDEARATRVQLDMVGLGYLIQGALEKVMARLLKNPSNERLRRSLEAALDLVATLPFELNNWKVQNIFYEIIQRSDVNHQLFLPLGERLRVRVEPALVQ
jgi:hypothetical protein